MVVTLGQEILDLSFGLLRLLPELLEFGQG